MNTKAMLASPKTTWLGITMILGAIVIVAKAFLEGTLETVDWSAVGASLIAGFGFIFARDADKSSQDSGIR